MTVLAANSMHNNLQLTRVCALGCTVPLLMFRPPTLVTSSLWPMQSFVCTHNPAFLALLLHTCCVVCWLSESSPLCISNRHVTWVSLWRGSRNWRRPAQQCQQQTSCNSLGCCTPAPVSSSSSSVNIRSRQCGGLVAWLFLTPAAMLAQQVVQTAVASGHHWMLPHGLQHAMHSGAARVQVRVLLQQLPAA